MGKYIPNLMPWNMEFVAVSFLSIISSGRDLKAVETYITGGFKKCTRSNM